MALTSLGSLGAAGPPAPPQFAARSTRRDTPAANGAQVRGVAVVRIKTRTLISLRLLAVAGQAAVLYSVSLGLKFPLPYFQCWILVGVSAWLNLVLMISPASKRAARPWEAGAQIVFDVVQLSWLLYYSGGVTNPFCILMIIPLTVAVATLPTRWAFAIGIISMCLVLVLAVAARPFPWRGAEPLNLPFVYRFGCALALMIGMSVTGGFAFWIAGQTSRMELALQITESVLAREQRLSALGTLAAAAAHELGTPLATISVVAKEMARDAPEGALREDAWLLLDEAQRCRGILRRLTDTPEAADALRERMSLVQFVRELVEPYAGDPVVRAEAVVTGPSDMAAPDIWRLTEVFHAMTSIVENAFDFAKAEILVTARFDATSLQVEVRDDGPGFSQDIIAKLGDPYVTSRPGAEGSRTGHIGMGLGFFIAKTLLERTGAKVEFRNARPRGAVVAARWPRDRIEALEVEED
jgi:two-component system sensor histidine kinase RegB